MVKTGWLAMVIMLIVLFFWQRHQLRAALFFCLLSYSTQFVLSPTPPTLYLTLILYIYQYNTFRSVGSPFPQQIDQKESACLQHSAVNEIQVIYFS